MEQANDQEFFSLLYALLKEQTISVPNTDGKTYTFQALNANQLKQLIQTLFDKSLNNISFNSTILQIMQQNLVVSEGVKPVEQFNIIDKNLFLLSARIQAIANKVYMLGDDNLPFEVELNSLIDNLVKYVTTTGIEQLNEKEIGSNNIKAVVGLPYAQVDVSINQETYQNITITEDMDPKKLEEFVGNAFIAEIAKWIKTLTINDKVLDFSSLTFKNKMKTTFRNTVNPFMPQSIAPFIQVGTAKWHNGKGNRSGDRDIV